MRRIGLDAALMIHEDGASEDEVEADVRRWGARDAGTGGAHDPLRHRPTWRAYVINYSAGGSSAGWVGGDPAGSRGC